MSRVPFFDGCEVREVDDGRVARRRFRLEDVCPADSECLRAVRRASAEMFLRRSGQDGKGQMGGNQAAPVQEVLPFVVMRAG